MKKIIALFLIVLLCLSAAGCSAIQLKERGTEAVTEAPTEAPTAAPTEAPTSAPRSNKMYATVDECLNSDAMKESLNSAKEMGGDVMTIEVYADGPSLVYDYKFNETYDQASVAIMKDSLDSSLESSAGTFENIASVVQSQVDEEGVNVVVIYRNGDGAIITQRTFYQQ